MFGLTFCFAKVTLCYVGTSWHRANLHQRKVGICNILPSAVPADSLSSDARTSWPDLSGKGFEQDGNLRTVLPLHLGLLLMQIKSHFLQPLTRQDGQGEAARNPPIHPNARIPYTCTEAYTQELSHILTHTLTKQSGIFRITQDQRWGGGFRHKLLCLRSFCFRKEGPYTEESRKCILPYKEYPRWMPTI